jgi:hypothetical protein
MPPGPRIAELLRLIDQAYDRKSWHGTNLRGSLRGLSAEFHDIYHAGQIQLLKRLWRIG